MALATSNRDGGKTSENGHLRSVSKWTTGKVIDGFRVRQNTTPNMTVLIGGESGIDDDLYIRNTALKYSHPVWTDDGNAVSATVSTANTSNPRIDIVVVYVDYGQPRSTSVENNTNGVIKAAVIPGTPAASPARPTQSQINAVIGATNYHTELAQITVPANATTITNAMITDTRQMASAKLAPSSGLAAIYPIGSVYINASDNSNPSTLFGFGTWVQFGAGRVPVGFDSTQTEFNSAEKTGGAKTHKLTIAEMPSHNHTASVRGAINKSEGSGPANAISIDYYNTTTSNTGGDGSHNNLQPYVTVYMWKRTA